MDIQELAISGVLLIQPKIWSDDRGFFMEVYHQESFINKGVSTSFVQDNLSFSKKGVIRGLHFQRPPRAQAKLVRCVRGSVFDVAADVDPTSGTYGQHVSAILSEENHAMLFIPGKYAHGFCVVSDAVVEYKMDALYAPEFAGGVRYNDPALAIEWPEQNPILSKQDKQWPYL